MKIFILLITGLILAGTGCIYNPQQDKIVIQQQKQINELTKKIDELGQQKTTTTKEVKKTEKQPLIQSQPVTKMANERIRNQIILFDKISSDIITGPQVNCMILVTYNNINKYGDESASMVAESKDNYDTVSKGCFAYTEIRRQISGLVAEPELVSARKKLSEISNLLQKLGLYVLYEKGADGMLADNYNKQIDELITEVKEDLVNVIRQNNIKF